MSLIQGIVGAAEAGGVSWLVANYLGGKHV
jgi:hypothetical protein